MHSPLPLRLSHWKRRKIPLLIISAFYAIVYVKFRKELKMLNNLIASALMPLAGDRTSIWPYILIGAAVILIIAIVVININKNKKQ